MYRSKWYSTYKNANHNILNYNDFQKQLNVPFVISTDFESIT